MKKTLFIALSWATIAPALAQNNTDSSTVRQSSTGATLPERNLYYNPYDAFRLRLAKHVVYPDLARKMGAEGTVQVRIRVCPNGIGEQATIVRSAGSVLDRAALEAVYAILPFRFTTAPDQRYSVDYPIMFRLQ